MRNVNAEILLQLAGRLQETVDLLDGEYHVISYEYEPRQRSQTLQPSLLLYIYIYLQKECG